MPKYQVKITGPTMRGVAIIREEIIKYLKGNYSTSNIHPSTPDGFHTFINIELETAP